MTRPISIVLATLLAAGCSEYSVAHDTVNPGPVDETLAEGSDAGTPSDGEWQDETDPSSSGGGSGAIRPDDPVDAPDAPEDDADPEDPEEPAEAEEPDPSVDPDPDPGDDDEPEEGLTPEPGDGEPRASNGRMTGGGSLWHGDLRVTHGMTLRCDATAHNNRLEINWDGGHKFHLDHLLEVECFDDPALDPGRPSAGFDTMWALGVGVDGSEIELWLTDDGEPGTTDIGSFLIQDDSGVVLDVSSELDRGNHQAHGDGNIEGPGDSDGTAALTRSGCTTTGGVPVGAGAWLATLLLAARRR